LALQDNACPIQVAHSPKGVTGKRKAAKERWRSEAKFIFTGKFVRSSTAAHGGKENRIVRLKQQAKIQEDWKHR